MFHWKTNEVLADLRKIPLVKDVKNTGPGGDVDTDHLRIEVRGSPDPLYVCGFNVDGDPKDQSNSEVEMVELTDGRDSRGGLNSDNDNTGQVWLQVRQYFRSKGIEVVDTMDDYF